MLVEEIARMLVMLGPWFEATPEGFARLAHATGLVPYELRSRIKPACWGLLRAVGDGAQAEALAVRLRDEGFPVVVVNQREAFDAEHRVVPVERVELRADELVLRVRDQDMPIPYQSLMVIVRGELGRASGSRPAPSSATFRPVVPSAAEAQAFREAAARGGADASPAADLHFVTVRWFGRIDVRDFDFAGVVGASAGQARDLDRLLELLAERSGARVDRGSKMSGVSAFGGSRSLTPAQGPRAARDVAPDDPFDVYSHLVSEAELLAYRLRLRPRPAAPG
jgi:hypothetical protein